MLLDWGWGLLERHITQAGAWGGGDREKGKLYIFIIDVLGLDENLQTQYLKIKNSR